jgi:predicted dehydrogenase
MPHFTRPIQRSANPLRLGVVGLTHTHVGWPLHSGREGAVSLVGVYEPSKPLFDRYAKQYDLDPSIHFTDLDEFIDQARPEGLSVMNSIYEHAETVERLAKYRVPMLIEKPLAVCAAHANRIAAASRAHDCPVLTNYETSWYAGIREAERRLRKGELGELRRMVFETGHPGPVEIGCPIEFLDWLCDPVLNGGGAITDFGCYGIICALWLMDGKVPDSVACTAATTKPDVYPNVDDDATIILQWADGPVAVIQPSWAWTHDVKSSHFFGEIASAHCGKWDELAIRESNHEPKAVEPSPIKPPGDDQWRYLAAVARDDAAIDPMSSLELNVKCCEILDQARRAAGLAVPG